MKRQKTTKRIGCLLLALMLAVSVLCTGCKKAETAAEVKEETPSEANAANVEASAEMSAPEASSERKITDTGITIVDGKRQLNVGWEYTINALSPYVLLGGTSSSYYLLCLESLCAYDAQYNVHNVLAKEWTVDETGTICTVEIYDYINDSEGTKITAEDVCYSIEKCREKGVVTNLKAATPTGDYTLTIELERYDSHAMEKVLTGCPVVSKAKYEASSDEMATNLIATGPYKVAEHIIGSTTTYEANENYWQRDEALKGPYAYQNVDRIKFVTLSELSQREIALETGELDYIHSPSTSTIEMLGEDDTYVYTQNAGPHTYMFQLSMRGIFSDIRAREAFTLAIDRDGLINGALNGNAYKMGVGVPAAHYRDSWTETDHAEYNPEKAKKLLEEAGVIGQKVTILATANYSTIYEMVQAYLLAVGFDVEVVTEEQAAWGNDRKDYTKYDVTMVRMQGNDCAFLYKSYADRTAGAHKGCSMTGIQDDKLQELYEAICAPGGNTQENNDAMHDYLVENYYIYCPMRSSVLDMWRADCGLIELAHGIAMAPAFGASTYVWTE